MPDAFASRRGLTLIKTPSARQQAARRRALTAGGVLALAVASGVIGAISHPRTEPLGKAHTGPFSYFPSE